jgi:hypothetical protein
MSALPKTVFIGWNYDSVVSYYRCFLPAMVLGVDHLVWKYGRRGVELLGGLGDTPEPDVLYDYDIVVLQQPAGRGWLNVVRELQANGVRVLYEIDDYIQGARKTKSHELSDVFDEKLVHDMEMVMRVCDGVIVTTGFLARRYRSFNARTWACPNGIDLPRYRHTKPPRQGVTIGWAGGIGHKASLARWEAPVRNVMRARPETRFVSVGYGAATPFIEEFGYAGQLDAFENDLDTGETPFMSAEFGRAVLDVVCAAYQSAGQDGAAEAVPFTGDRSKTPLQLWHG